VSRETGATMVEFALVSVVAFAIIFGLAELGLVVFGNSVGSSAARDGARVGLVNYVDADVAGSPNNLAVVAAVKQRLVGIVTYQSASVVCRPADDLTATEPCQPASVDLARNDLIEVAVTWRHKGAAAFGPATHSATARMVIGGAPDLSTTATTSSTTTTTTAPSTTTTTAPSTQRTVMAAQMADNDHDGRIDQVQVTFSGALDPSCTSGWTLANVPSGGSLAGVTISGSTATLAVTEGPGVPDTAVGGFTVAFAGCSNAAAFGPLAPSDAAGPVFVSLGDGGGVDGKPEPGDTLDLTFSEPLSPTWGPSTTVTVTIARQGNQDATITVPSLVSGNTFDSGSPGYVAKNQTATFNNSTLTVSGPTLRLTLGSACTGCTSTGVGQGSFTFTPSGTIRDAGGYVSIAPITATNLKLF
jgi:hypothetical protein